MSRNSSGSNDSDFVPQTPNASTSKFAASSRFPAGAVFVSRIWSGAEWIAELDQQKGFRVHYRLVGGEC